jgi:hypothetical protein
LVYLLTLLFTSSLFAEQYVYVSAKGDKTLDIYQFNSANGKLKQLVAGLQPFHRGRKLLRTPNC